MIADPVNRTRRADGTRLTPTAPWHDGFDPLPRQVVRSHHGEIQTSSTSPQANSQRAASAWAAAYPCRRSEPRSLVTSAGPNPKPPHPTVIPAAPTRAGRWFQHPLTPTRSSSLAARPTTLTASASLKTPPTPHSDPEQTAWKTLIRPTLRDLAPRAEGGVEAGRRAGRGSSLHRGTRDQDRQDEPARRGCPLHLSQAHSRRRPSNAPAQDAPCPKTPNPPATSTSATPATRPRTLPVLLRAAQRPPAQVVPAAGHSPGVATEQRVGVNPRDHWDRLFVPPPWCPLGGLRFFRVSWGGHHESRATNARCSAHAATQIAHRPSTAFQRLAGPGAPHAGQNATPASTAAPHLQQTAAPPIGGPAAARGPTA